MIASRDTEVQLKQSRASTVERRVSGVGVGVGMGVNVGISSGRTLAR